MRIQEQDLYHGAALTQIVESSEFTALNRDPGKYGLYVVNHDRALLVKHAAKPRSDGRYAFTFSVAELKALKAQERQHPGLVCSSRSSVVTVSCAGSPWMTSIRWWIVRFEARSGSPSRLLRVGNSVPEAASVTGRSSRRTRSRPAS